VQYTLSDEPKETVSERPLVGPRGKEDDRQVVDVPWPHRQADRDKVHAHKQRGRSRIREDEQGDKVLETCQRKPRPVASRGRIG
jgi:hypothetical protein